LAVSCYRINQQGGLIMKLLRSKGSNRERERERESRFSPLSGQVLKSKRSKANRLWEALKETIIPRSKKHNLESYRQSFFYSKVAFFAVLAMVMEIINPANFLLIKKTHAATTVAWETNKPGLSTASENAPEVRNRHAAVWTGSKMIVWGGSSLNTGGVYDPSANTWVSTSLTGAPAGRSLFSAVWTGTEMVVWGGQDVSNNKLNTGGRYNPTTDTWAAISTTGAPTARSYANAVWDGTEMIIQGGIDNSGRVTDGAKYNPSTNTWSAISSTGAPSERYMNSVVWTGSEMIVWGGYDGTSDLNTGAKYNPSNDTWTAISTTNAPSAREEHKAIWTGTEMIVWGGWDGAPANDGAKYNPSTDIWTAISATGAPSGRFDHLEAWTGTEMVVWGGNNNVSRLNDGAKYNPSNNTWSAITTSNAPGARDRSTAIWTGSKVVIWGGWDGTSNLNNGGLYNPSNDSWSATSLSGGLSKRTDHVAVWTGSQMIVWGGWDGTDTTTRTQTGSKYDPLTDTWAATTTNGAPTGRYRPSAIWTGTDMIVWGGKAGNAVNDGGKYNPSSNTWTATSTTNAPVGRELHTAIWNGTEMIVWGGRDGSNGLLGDGAKYNPSNNTWAAISNTGAPTARQDAKAVWTGSKMIVWGGYDGSGQTNTGAVYDPSNDTWTAMSTTNAPSARDSATAIWDGTEMIIWGGYDGSSALNTGAKYNPSNNTWTAISTTGVPTARNFHSTVWTGTEMIVWGGGNNGSSLVNTGARYNPTNNTWVALSTTNAPLARQKQTTVWGDSKMLIWGGDDGSTPLGNGGSLSVSYDTTPPNISSISSGTPGQTSATITWTTNEASDSQVEYGLTTGYGSSTTLDTSLITSHSVGLSILTANTTYHYRVKSKDTDGNLATSSDNTFITAASPDTTAPVISSVSSGTPGQNSATITWTTDEQATTRVEWGLTTSYGTSQLFNNGDYSTSHSATLTSLLSGTTYHFRVKSEDAANNLATSTDYSFTTAGTPDTTAPVISNVSSGTPGQTSVTITWTTNEAADSQVDYGLTTSYGSSSGDSNMVTSHSRTLTGLTAGTTYHFRVVSKDAASNQATGTDNTFTTTSSASGGDTVILTGHIPAVGGSITSDDGSIVVTFPQDAVTETVSVTVAITTTDHGKPQSTNKIGSTFSISAKKDSDNSDVTTFAKPILITISYAGATVGIPQNLTVYYWDVASSSWKQDGISGIAVDSANKKVTFGTTHFTDFSLFESTGTLPTTGSLGLFTATHFYLNFAIAFALYLLGMFAIKWHRKYYPTYQG